jgi:hypothetical protein
VSGRRTVRTRPRNGLAIRDVLAAALLSELCNPSEEFWLVSGWVSDVRVIDNSARQFDSLLGDEPPASMTLSGYLGELTRRGTHVHLALRVVDHNKDFVDRLKRVCTADGLHLYYSEDLHEKMLVGWEWILTGSMNFTWMGTQVNEERMEFLHDRVEAARQRIELRARWIGGQA